MTIYNAYNQLAFRHPASSGGTVTIESASRNSAGGGGVNMLFTDGHVAGKNNPVPTAAEDKVFWSDDIRVLYW